ncbi:MULTISPECIES: Rha family transcriptional regulator [unclassified Levilactobacillus]|uniref:Rha family transcriptional regulator n=1 Tax=unclassified Levilactobacillus TaxID=2767918 RepID=UPI002FF2B750
MTDLVIAKDKQAVTSSLQIAETFGKQHKHVIEAIQGKINSAENSAQYNSMFAKGTYKDRSGKSNPMYYMNRDGFAFIVMGFTGRKADKFKLQYIDAFNEMEQQIKFQIPTTLPEALRLAADQAEKISKLQPKAEYTDHILANPGLETTSVIAKNYGQSTREFNKLLHGLGIQYKQGKTWLLYSKYQDKGYTHVEPYSYVDSKGLEQVRNTMKWTQSGQHFLYEFLKSKGVLPVVEQSA